MTITDILQQSPIIPVITIAQVEDALPLADALIAGGINTLEITLRTKAALEAISTIVKARPQACVGAGTVIHPNQFDQVKAAGCQFAVSPGLTPALADGAQKSGLPFLPGAITPSEIIAAQALGYSILKFFPTELSGGIKAIKTLHAVFPQVRFTVTGGIGLDNLVDYLALDAVVAVGGSWLTPPKLIHAQDWSAITKLTQQSVSVISNQ